MADITGASLGSIKNRLSGAATYHPMEAETFSDWATEAGDVVTVKRGNESYNSPVYSSKLVWKGAPQMTLSSTGNKERESLQKVSSKKYRKNGAAVRNSQNQRYFVEDLYKQMRAGLDLTSSSASLYVESKYDAMKSGLDLTSSSASLYVESKYDAMKSGLDLTMSSASLYVESKYDAMKSGLDLTMSSASLYVENKYTAMKSGLDLTMSSAALYVENKYTAMKSGLDLTMSSAAVYVESLYNQMKAGLDVTSSSAALYAYNRTTRAQIIARINGEGKSEALIEAQNIKIGSRNNSDIKLNDRITIDSSGNLEVSGNLFVSLTGSPDYYVRTKKVKLIGASSSQGAQETDLTYSDVASMIVQAQVSGNTLYLWKKGDTLTTEGASFSFSKATTVGPTWSSGNFPLTINATQTNDGVTTNVGSYTIGFTNASQIYLEIDKNGDIAAFGTSRKVINVPYKITQKQTINGVNQDSIRYTGSIAAVDATSVYNNGWNDARTATEIPTTDIGSTSIDSTYGTVTVKKPNADGVSTKTSYDYSINLTNYTPPGTTTKIGISEIKYSSNVVARKTITNLQAGNIKAGVSICGISGTFTSDADATAARILNGYTAYVNGSKVTGSIPTSGNSGTTITPGTSSKTAINGGHYASSNITVAGDSDLTAGNIKSGVTIFGVTGSFTSDATASATCILDGYTAYINGSLVTGSIPTSGNSGTTITPGTSSKVAINGGHYASSNITVAGDSYLTAGNIKKGVTIFGVTGSYTSDATAAAGHILSGKTAYVNGSKITGSIPTSSNSGETITPGTYEKTAINGGQYASSNIKVAGDSDLVAGNIKKNVTIFGVTGSYQSSVTDISMWTGDEEWTGTNYITSAWRITAAAKVDGSWVTGTSMTVAPKINDVSNWSRNGSDWTKRTGDVYIGVTGSITLYPFSDSTQGNSVTVHVSHNGSSELHWDHNVTAGNTTYFYYWTSTGIVSGENTKKTVYW